MPTDITPTSIVQTSPRMSNIRAQVAMNTDNQRINTTQPTGFGMEEQEESKGVIGADSLFHQLDVDVSPLLRDDNRGALRNPNGQINIEEESKI